METALLGTPETHEGGGPLRKPPPQTLHHLSPSYSEAAQRKKMNVLRMKIGMRKMIAQRM